MERHDILHVMGFKVQQSLQNHAGPLSYMSFVHQQTTKNLEQKGNKQLDFFCTR